ncbi:MAG TPA: SufS family cysteine desulfurase [Candidatus Limnocylindria bacterium]|nr:SufS family cysteine desulfurase [Candidatus Limnocylindria bacterium]
MALPQTLSPPQVERSPRHDFDGAALRADFPVFDEPTRGGQRLVFLDSAASSQKPRSVIEALADTYAHHYANVHRGIYELSEDATRRFEAARRRLARFIGAPSDREVVFVRNATEAINLVAHAWGASIGPGDTVVSTEMEHHANLVPWQQLAARSGCGLEFVHLTEDGGLDLDELRRRVRGDERGGRPARLLAVSHVSNALGTINPVRQIVDIAHEAGALVLLDAAQSVPHLPVSVAQLGVDFAVVSGHKMLGPSGIGLLWGRRELLDAMPPFLTGGSMISRVTLDGTEWNEVPWKFEAGTPAIAEAIGLAAAADYLDRLGMDAVRGHERRLFELGWNALGEIDGVRRLGPSSADEHAGVISFVVEGIHPHDVATVLDHHGVAVRAGHHCAQPVMARYDLPATTRTSFYVYNDADDVERLTAALRACQRLFGTA